MSIYTSPILVVGNKNYSSCSMRAWLAMRKVEVHFEEKLLYLGSEKFADEIANWSPVSRVPVLKDHERVVWDSLAIVEYINENYAEHKLWPKNFAERARARSISCEIHSEFVALKSQMPMNIRASRRVKLTAELELDINRVHQIWRECRRAHKELGEWLFGEFSIVDAMFAPVVMCFKTYDVHLPEPSAEYMAHVCADGDVRHWVEVALAESAVVVADEVGEEVVFTVN